MIHVGDMRVVLPTFALASIDAIVTDPPYHLTTGKKGGTGQASDNPNSPAGRARIGTGFMGKAWDGGDVAFQPDTWAECLRVAKPGAYLLAFGGTRTFHRLMVAIEDAGWEIRDTLMWVYGSGFPKSKNIGGGYGTALKPAWEPIIMARKALIGTVAANHAAHGTGALNIDGCRIAIDPDADIGQLRSMTRNERAREDGYGMNGQGAQAAVSVVNATGRWPANLVHDGSEEVVAEFPREAGASAPVLGTEPSRPAKNTYGTFERGGGAFHGDSGSAARFFYCAKADREDRNWGCDGMEEKPLLWSSGAQSPGTFQAQGTKRASENNHPTVKPHDLMRWLCRLVTPPGGLVLDPFTGSGSTGRAAIAEGMRFVGVELDPGYAAIVEARLRATQPGFAFTEAVPA